MMLDKETFKALKEDLKKLVLTTKLPVAVLDLETLAKLGDWELIKKDVYKERAVRLKNVKDQMLARYIGDHIWVSPKLSRKECSEAWVDAGFDKPMNPDEQKDFRRENGFGPVSTDNLLCVHQLDHVHAMGWAAEQGYGYVLLTNVSSGSNMSAGSVEKKKKEEAKKYGPGYAKEHPVKYATRIHWAKLQHFRQYKPGQPMRESRGIRV